MIPPASLSGMYYLARETDPLTPFDHDRAGGTRVIERRTPFTTGTDRIGSHYGVIVLTVSWPFRCVMERTIPEPRGRRPYMTYLPRQDVDFDIDVDSTNFS